MREENKQYRSIMRPLNADERAAAIRGADSLFNMNAAVQVGPDALAAVQDAPFDVRECVRSAIVKVAMGLTPSQWERDTVFAWVSRHQQQNRYGKAVH